MLIGIIIVAILGLAAWGTYILIKSSSEEFGPEESPKGEEVVEEEESLAEEKDEFANWEIYRNEEYGFELKHPEDWGVEESKNVEINSFNVILQGLVQEKPKFKIEINPPGIGYEFLKTTSTDDVMVGGREARKISFSAESAFGCNEGVKGFRLFFTNKIYLFDKDKDDVRRFDSFIWATFCLDGSDHTNILDQILSTFKFTLPVLSEDEAKEEICKDQPLLVKLSFKGYELSKVFVEERGELKPLTAEEWAAGDYKWDCVDSYYIEEDIPDDIFNKFPQSDLLRRRLNTADWKTYYNEKLGIEFKYPEEWQVEESKTEGEHIKSRVPYEDAFPVLGPFVIWINSSTAGANWGTIDEAKSMFVDEERVLLITRDLGKKVYYTVKLSVESYNLYIKYTPSQQGSLGWSEDYHLSVFATILNSFDKWSVLK